MEKGTAVRSWLEANELAIRTVFRLLVIALLTANGISIYLTFEESSDAEYYASEAYDAALGAKDAALGAKDAAEYAKDISSVAANAANAATDAAEEAGDYCENVMLFQR